MIQAHKRWSRAGTILMAAVALCWPAMWNGYPLLFADSIRYLGDGPRVWKTVLTGPKGDFIGTRSEIYSAGIYLLHWGRSPWPVAWVQGLATAWVVWLVVRAFVSRRTEGVYLAVMALLCVSTSVAWFVSLPLADAWGPLLYLGVFLVVFARETLRRWERITLLCLCTWSVAAHSSHLLVAAGLWVVVAALVAIQCRGEERGVRRRGVFEVAAVLLLAVGMQLAVHWRMYGEPSVAGKRLPFLTARAIYDGPAKIYLSKNCDHLGWTICRYMGSLPANEYDFMFAANGVWHRATEPERDEMRRQEMPLVLATVRRYPRRQLRRSWANFEREGMDLNLGDMTNNTFLMQNIGLVEQGGNVAYARTLQAHNGLPIQFFGAFLKQTFWFAIGALLVLPLWHCRRFTWLCLVTVTALLLNAAVTGVIAVADARLQTRVTWLAVLVAATGLVHVWEQRRNGEGAESYV